MNLSGSALANIDISSSLQTQLTGINSALTAIQDEDTAQNTLNNQLTSVITDVQNGKQNVIDADNKVSSLYVSYNATTVKDEFDALESYNASNSTTIASVQSSITSLGSTKQDVINESNKRAVSNVNLGTSALSYVDISSSLQGDLNSITSDISSLTTSLNTNTSAISILVSADVQLDNAISTMTSDISN